MIKSGYSVHTVTEVIVYINVIISVWSGVLMIASQSMEYLMCWCVCVGATASKLYIQGSINWHTQYINIAPKIFKNNNIMDNIIPYPAPTDLNLKYGVALSSGSFGTKRMQVGSKNPIDV